MIVETSELQSRQMELCRLAAGWDSSSGTRRLAVGWELG